MVNLSKIRQLLALMIIIASLALAAAIALKAYRGMRSAPILPSLPKNIDVSLQKIHYTETKDGVKKWDLLADKAEYDKAREVVRLSDVRLDVAVAGKIGDIVLTSARAEYNTRSRNVELSGDVRAKSTTGMEFTSKRISYVAASSMLRTTDRVKFTNGNMTVEGTGMEYKADSKTLRLLRQVEAEYTAGAAQK